MPWIDASNIVRCLLWEKFDPLRQILGDRGDSYASRAPGALRAQIRVWTGDLDLPLPGDDTGG